MTHAQAYSKFNGSDIGTRVRALRKDCGLSLQALGDLAGFSKSHVWELEDGRIRNPSSAMIDGLACALNTDSRHILYGEDSTAHDAVIGKFDRLSKKDRRKILAIMDIFLEGKTQ